MSTEPFFMRRTSLEDDPYACSYCSQRYPSQRDLDIHEYMHGNYVKEAIFDLAVQPRISYLTYEYFTFECRGMVSAVLGKESGCAETPEQDYEDEKNVSYNGNGELFSTSDSLINIYQPTSQPDYKYVCQPLMTHFTLANQQPSVSYTPPNQPPGPSYTPPIQILSPSYTPPIQPPLSPSYTPPTQPPLNASYTPSIQQLSPSYTPTNPAIETFGSIALPDQHNADRDEKPSMKLENNGTPSEKIAVTANADLTSKCQTLLFPADHESNHKTLYNGINRFISSCRIEQGSMMIESGSKGNSPWIS